MACSIALRAHTADKAAGAIEVPKRRTAERDSRGAWDGIPNR
jgi:hypothetical protein